MCKLPVSHNLDERLPYHQKHERTMDGLVPYNGYDGFNLEDQLKVENVTSKYTKEVWALKSRKLVSKQIELNWLVDKYIPIEKGTVKVARGKN